MYTGPWLTDAKKDFSSTTARAAKKGQDYLNGKRERQKFLETVLEWISDRDDCDVEGYMSAHQHDTNANELWLYFSAVIDWADTRFPWSDKNKKGLSWGIFYNKYAKDFNPDPAELKAEYTKCMADSDVTCNSGIYEYLLTGNTKTLNIRKFSNNERMTAYAQCGGICAKCGKKCELDQMEADHITPWSKGGHTDISNLQMLCKECNRRKSNL